METSFMNVNLFHVYGNEYKPVHLNGTLLILMKKVQFEWMPLDLNGCHYI